MKTLFDCFYVGFGGLLGTVSRYLLGLLPVRHSSGFPIVTLFINVAGAFLIGVIAALAEKSAGMDPRALLFWKVGICGGFTTFSTFALETQNLLSSGKTPLAFCYAALSVVLCVAAVMGADALVR